MQRCLIIIKAEESLTEQDSQRTSGGSRVGTDIDSLYKFELIFRYHTVSGANIYVE